MAGGATLLSESGKNIPRSPESGLLTVTVLASLCAALLLLLLCVIGPVVYFRYLRKNKVAPAKVPLHQRKVFPSDFDFNGLQSAAASHIEILQQQHQKKVFPLLAAASTAAERVRSPDRRTQVHPSLNNHSSLINNTNDNNNCNTQNQSNNNGMNFNREDVFSPFDDLNDNKKALELEFVDWLEDDGFQVEVQSQQSTPTQLRAHHRRGASNASSDEGRSYHRNNLSGMDSDSSVSPIIVIGGTEKAADEDSDDSFFPFGRGRSEGSAGRRRHSHLVLSSKEAPLSANSSRSSHHCSSTNTFIGVSPPPQKQDELREAFVAFVEDGAESSSSDGEPILIP